MGFLIGFFSLFFVFVYVQQPSILVPNAPPQITITSPTYGYQTTYGVPINFTATASDKEDGNLANQVVWESSIDGAIGQQAVLSEGSHTVTAKVVDSEGVSVTKSIVVSVMAAVPENTPPSVEIISPSTHFSVEEGYSFLFKATATDQEDGTLSNNVTWASSIDGQIADLTTLSIGEHVVTATVADSEGLTAEDSIIVTVSEPSVVASQVEISWRTPEHRDDGSDLGVDDIAGFEITLAGKHTGEQIVIEVDDGYATSLVTDPILPDEYTLTMRTYDLDGLFSVATAPVVVYVSH